MPLLYSDLAGHFGKMEQKTINLHKDTKSLEIELEKEELERPEQAEQSAEAAKAKKEHQLQFEKLRRELAPEIRKEILDETVEERDTILRVARTEAEAIEKISRQQGYESGYMEGMQKGLEEGRDQAFAEAQEECDALRKQAELTRRQAKSVLEAAHEKSRSRADRKRQEIVDLAVAIAQKIIHAELDADKELIPAIAEEACKEFKKRKNIVFSVYPDNAEIFEASVPAFSKICPNAEFVILPDESVEQNGCIIESDTTVLDVQVTSQLENIKQALYEIEGDMNE